MRVFVVAACLTAATTQSPAQPADGHAVEGHEFFERRIRPLLVKHCFECHSEDAQERQGGLLLDRRSGWIRGGDTEEAVLPGEPDESLLIRAVEYTDENLQMPPDGRLSKEAVMLLREWVRRGAPGSADDRGETSFSRLGDQDYLFQQAADHWSFQPIQVARPAAAAWPAWNNHAIDQFVAQRLAEAGVTPGQRADARTLIRRLSYRLTSLPPSRPDVVRFEKDFQADGEAAIASAVDQLLASPQFGEHVAQMWLDVARYADTDGAYRPDTRTPHYFPFAFTYRDYVIDSFNADKPFDQFVKEQLAADLMEFAEDAPERAALGFLAAGPHANRNQRETVDDQIDVTTRGLLGLTAACARCHDHKYEPVPTADYYSLHGVFSSTVRVHPLDEVSQPLISGYPVSETDVADYRSKREAVDRKIDKAGGSKAKGNNRPVAVKIKETELAQLLSFHPGAPARAMTVKEARRPVEPFILIRGDVTQRGQSVPRRFLRILDPQQQPFPRDTSGRLQLAGRIVDPQNPLTARVFVNRIWGLLYGSYIVDTPSDFGLQGASPTHPELLDWLAADFVSHGWSVKHLVRSIVLSRTWQQSSQYRSAAAAADPQNKLLWRANRQRLSIEELRDSILSVSGQLDLTPRGRPGDLWGDSYTRRRTVYGYINRFNLDPTLRAFDFPAPMQSQGRRDESIVPVQALFTMNSPMVIDLAKALTMRPAFRECVSHDQRVHRLFELILQRSATHPEIERFQRFADLQSRHKPTKNTDDAAATWPLAAQAIMMSNEFLYLD